MCYWDLIFRETVVQPAQDSSAAAVAVCRDSRDGESTCRSTRTRKPTGTPCTGFCGPLTSGSSPGRQARETSFCSTAFTPGDQAEAVDEGNIWRLFLYGSAGAVLEGPEPVLVNGGRHGGKACGRLPNVMGTGRACRRLPADAVGRGQACW